MKKVLLNLRSAASRWMLLMGVMMMALSLNSCDDLFNRDKDKEEEIKIPGLGNTEGDPTGTPFKLPDGVELTGDITGAVDQDDYWEVLAAGRTDRWITGKAGKEKKMFLPVETRADDDPPTNYRGSGASYVDLLFLLRNTRSTPVEVTIPAATIFISKAGDCQNGVLIKKVTFTIPANGVYRLCLALYCGNLSKSGAGRSDVYIFGVVSDSRALLDLCDKVKNKKINIEEFSRTNSSDYSTYSGQTSRLQSIVWEITDYSGRLDSDDIAYLNSLPNSN